MQQEIKVDPTIPSKDSQPESWIEKIAQIQPQLIQTLKRAGVEDINISRCIDISQTGDLDQVIKFIPEQLREPFSRDLEALLGSSYRKPNQRQGSTRSTDQRTNSSEKLPEQRDKVKSPKFVGIDELMEKLQPQFKIEDKRMFYIVKKAIRERIEYIEKGEKEHEELMGAREEPRGKLPFNLRQQLTKILSQAEIVQKDKTEQCINLFKQNKIEMLKQTPKHQFRSQFGQAIDSLISRLKQEQSLQDAPLFIMEYKLRQSLIQSEVTDQQEIKQCIRLLHQRNIEALTLALKRLHHKPSAMAIDYWLEIIKIQNTQTYKTKKELYNIFQKTDFADETVRTNETCMLSLILNYANPRLRVELMNLARYNFTIPLYFKNQQITYSQQRQHKQYFNYELLWILKEGFTIASLGLHNQKTADKETGKSSLLNEIFPTHFEETQNKNAITRGLPYVAARVFQDLIPVHIIDIPHDCPANIANQILANSNMAIVHSWKNGQQTEEEFERLKQGLDIPSICLIRDCKEKNVLESLKQNLIAQEKPQRITNLMKKQTCRLEINLLKEQIYSFIQSRLNKNANLYKLRSLFDKDFEQEANVIERTTRSRKEYEIIYQNYDSRISEQTKGSQGLPKQKIWIGDEHCDDQTIKALIKQEIMQPQQGKFEDALTYTQKTYTNIYTGGKTDATLDYYNIHDHFRFENQKPEPIDKNGFFSLYLNDAQLTSKELKRPQFKPFILNQLKKKNSFQKLFDKVFSIVEKTLSLWKKAEKRTYVEVYNLVSQEISKFNNDLNQVSCNLSDRYISYLHLAVVHMIWKFSINQEIREEMQRYDTRNKKLYEYKWRLFLDQTLEKKDCIALGETNMFMDQFCKGIKQAVEGKKQQYKQQAQHKFFQEITRDKIQNDINCQLLEQAKQNLHYLENRGAAAAKMYDRYYEQSCNNFELKFTRDRTAQDLLQELYDILRALYRVLTDKGLDQNRGSFTDLFEIVGQENEKASPINQEQFLREGKKVLFQYLIDILARENPSRFRKCFNIDVKPIFAIQIQGTTFTPTKILRDILLGLKQIQHLTLTNIVLFMKTTFTSVVRERFEQKIDQMSKVTEQDRLSFINGIKVVVCREKCPCCAKVCDVENEHQYHQCRYGHQMRALGGCYILKPDNSREASVLKCEIVGLTNRIRFNGRQYSWKQLLEYFKNKKHGAWLFESNFAKKNVYLDKINEIWQKLGPDYCRIHNLSFVPCSHASIQQGPPRLHYIMALDQSGSMNGQPWNNLMASFSQTINKLIFKNVGQHNIKVSVIKFHSTASVIYENCCPHKITKNLGYSGGGTNFDPPFIEAASIAARYINDAVIVFIFMTDGEAPYPTKGMEAFKKLKAKYGNRLKYSGIQFGSNVQVLSQVCNELNGTRGVAYTPEQLTELFIRSIEVIAERQA